MAAPTAAVNAAASPVQGRSVCNLARFFSQGDRCAGCGKRLGWIAGFRGFGFRANGHIQCLERSVSLQPPIAAPPRPPREGHSPGDGTDPVVQSMRPSTVVEPVETPSEAAHPSGVTPGQPERMSAASARSRGEAQIEPLHTLGETTRVNGELQVRWAWTVAPHGALNFEPSQMGDGHSEEPAEQTQVVDEATHSRGGTMGEPGLMADDASGSHAEAVADPVEPPYDATHASSEAPALQTEVAEVADAAPAATVAPDEATHASSETPALQTEVAEVADAEPPAATVAPGEATHASSEAPALQTEVAEVADAEPPATVASDTTVEPRLSSNSKMKLKMAERKRLLDGQAS